MKTIIKVTGQIHGNHILVNELSSEGLVNIKEGMFFSKELVYETKKFARKALWKAFCSLRQADKDTNGKTDMTTRYAKGHAVYYDASKAEII